MGHIEKQSRWAFQILQENFFQSKNNNNAWTLMTILTNGWGTTTKSLLPKKEETS